MNDHILPRLKHVRKRRGMSQTDLAEAVGMSQSYYSEIESGRKAVNVKRLAAIAAVLEVRPDELLADPNEVDPLPGVARRIDALPCADRDLLLRILERLESKPPPADPQFA